MRVTRSSVGVRGMTLIELLCVIAIIGVLAALLLPALSQAKARARRLQCVDNLHQVGIGFVGFANDHNGQFPMAIPGSAGGTLELARSGNLLQGDFYFSYRHFQAASNELVTPKLLVCPADTRLPAASFTTLSNESLSYFIGVNAEFARPGSILAGDRNLTNDYATPGTVVRVGQGYVLRWTEELHRFKGNLLFSDGHVDEKNSPALISASGQVPAVENLALPTLRQPGTAASPPGGGSSPGTPVTSTALSVGDAGSITPTANTRSSTGSVPVIPSAIRVAPQGVSVTSTGGVSEKTPAPPRVEKESTNVAPASTPAKREEPEAVFSQFAVWLTAVTGGLVEKGMWWLYLLLLLLAILILVLRLWLRGRSKRTARPPARFP